VSAYFAQSATDSPQLAAQRANAWKLLVECFRQQREWTARELLEEARKRGIYRHILFQAREELELPGAFPRAVTWIWRAPDDWRYLHTDLPEPTPPKSRRQGPAVRLGLKQGDHQRLDRIAQSKGLNRASYLRMALLENLRKDEAALVGVS
jgi:hypothetical protein